MEWKYKESDYQQLWADAAKVEVMIVRIGTETEKSRSPRAVWAYLHGMNLEEMRDEKLRMPAWASRALRHPTYRQMVDNLTRITVLESDLAAAVTLKNVVKEGKQRAAIELLKQLTLLGEVIPPKDLLHIFKTLNDVDERLTLPEEAHDEEGHVKTAEEILAEEEKEFRSMVDKLPPAWQEQYLQRYQKKRGQELLDEKVKILREIRQKAAKK